MGILSETVLSFSMIAVVVVVVVVVDDDENAYPKTVVFVDKGDGN